MLVASWAFPDWKTASVSDQLLELIEHGFKAGVLQKYFNFVPQ